MRDYRSILQFSEEWLQLGIVTPQRIEELGKEHETSEDRNPEHYRYRAFQEYLRGRGPLSSADCHALYALGERDQDSGLGSAMMHVVVALAECPATLLKVAASSGRSDLTRLVARKAILGELKDGLSATLFETCLASRDRVVLEALLSCPFLSRAQLEQLASRAHSRAIRNVAGVRLRSSRKVAT
jgi:hypothetical protein